MMKGSLIYNIGNFHMSYSLTLTLIGNEMTGVNSPLFLVLYPPIATQAISVSPNVIYSYIHSHNISYLASLHQSL